MANIRMQICDVMRAVRGKHVEAAKKRSITVPGIATGRVTDTGNPASARLDLDVSDEGDRELDRMVERATKTTVEAWKPIMDLVPTPAPAKSTKGKADSEPSPHPHGAERRDEARLRGAHDFLPREARATG